MLKNKFSFSRKFFENRICGSVFSKLTGAKDFYQSVWRLALPIAAQSFIMSALNMVDTIMVGQLGETEIAAVGLGNQIYFILYLYLSAVGGSASIFIAQLWGKKDIHDIRRFLGLSLLINFISGLFFFVTVALVPTAILSFFSADHNLINIGAEYLRITSISYLMVAVTTSYSAALRSMEEVKLPMRVNAFALLLNAVLNYLLIFGKLGLPALGIRGAAIGTVIARCLEMLVLTAAVYGGKYLIAAKPREMFRFSGDLVKRFVATASTVVTKDMIWAVGVTLYAAVYGRMGTEVMAVMNIITTIRQLAFVLFIGLANACLIMVGKQIGAGEDKRAYSYGEKFLFLAVGFGLLTGVLVFSARGLLLAPYNISPDTVNRAGGVLTVFAVILFIIVFNMIAVVGIMRGGGDTMFTLVMDLIAVYFIGLPLAYLGGLVWQLPVEWVFALINVQEIFKMIVLMKRFITKKWINDLTHEVV